MQEKLKGAGGAPLHGIPPRNGNPQGFYHPSNSSTMTRDNQSYHSTGYSYDDSQDMSHNDPNGLYQGANVGKLDRNSMAFVPNPANPKQAIGKQPLTSFNNYANQDPAGRMLPNSVDNRQKSFANQSGNPPPNPQGPVPGQQANRGEYWNERGPGYQPQPQPVRPVAPGGPQFGNQPFPLQNRVQKLPQPEDTGRPIPQPAYPQQPRPQQPQMTEEQRQQYLLQQQQAEMTKQLMDKVSRNIAKLCDEYTRLEGMTELNLLKDKPMPIPFPKLLWDTPGSVAGLLTELVSLYPHLSKPTLSQSSTERAKQALILFSSIASNDETKKGFIAARMDQYIYPLISLQAPSKPHLDELQSAGFVVIIGLLRKPDIALVQLLVKTTRVFEICVNIMKNSSGGPLMLLSNLLMNKLLSDQQIVVDVCNHPQTLEAVLEGLIRVLTRVLEGIPKTGILPDQKRLLGFVLISLEKLSENESGKSQLLQALPAIAKQPSGPVLKDQDTQQKYDKLLKHLGLLD